MNTEKGSVQSDWPLALMLDEVWLRARRVLVHKLETSDLWPATEPHQAFMKRQRGQGEQLKSELLLRVLGEDDYAWLNSESVFGPSNQRLQAKMPIVLSFGYELGLGFGGLLDGQSSLQAAEMCSVFNLGISIFDLVCDHFHDLFEDFSEVFNEQVMSRLVDDSEPCHELSVAVPDISVNELRILLRIITWFMCNLHSLPDATKGNEAWRKLFRLLVEAYRMELRSTRMEGATRIESLSVSRAKSTLPFAIIHHVACLHADSSNGNIAKAVDSLVDRVALAFWQIDDMDDIIRDFQSGALNSLLVQSGAKPSQEWEPLRSYSVLRGLLEGDHVERMADDVCASISNVMDTLQQDRFDPSVAGRLSQVVMSYTRSWME